MLTADILNECHDHDVPQSIIDNEIANLVKNLEAKPGFNPHVDFDPKKHLKFTKETLPKKYTFKELGIEKTHVKPFSEIAATDPFGLLTDEAIDIIKWEAFGNVDIIKKYARYGMSGKNSEARDFHISGFVDDTKFTKALFSSKELEEIVSLMLGAEVSSPHVFTQGHINASLANLSKPEFDPDVDYEALKIEQDKEVDNIDSAVSWHYDSPPGVCVIMLSAPEKMIGGETGIRLGDESIIRIKNTQPGSATLLQGRVIKHIATKPLNNFDRISYVCSWAPRDPLANDTTCATSERPGAIPGYTNDRFYPIYLNYRFERVEKRLAYYREKLMENYKAKEKFDQKQAVDFIQDIEKYLQGCYQDFEVLSDTPYPPPIFEVPYKELPATSTAVVPEKII